MEIDESLRYILQNSGPWKSLELGFNLSRKPGIRGVNVLRFLGPNFDTVQRCSYDLTKTSFKLHSIFNTHCMTLVGSLLILSISPVWVVWVSTCPSTSERHRITVGIQYVFATIFFENYLERCMAQSIKLHTFSLIQPWLERHPTTPSWAAWQAVERKKKEKAASLREEYNCALYCFVTFQDGRQVPMSSQSLTTPHCFLMSSCWHHRWKDSTWLKSIFLDVCGRLRTCNQTCFAWWAGRWLCMAWYASMMVALPCSRKMRTFFSNRSIRRPNGPCTDPEVPADWYS